MYIFMAKLRQPAKLICKQTSARDNQNKMMRYFVRVECMAEEENASAYKHT